MKHDLEISGKHLALTLSGHFTFAENQTFRRLMNDMIAHEPTQVTLKISDMDYIDSSALGMLLLLRENFQEKGITLELQQPEGQVAKMFEISKFDALFTITN